MRILPVFLPVAVPLIAQQSPRTLAEMRDHYRPLLIFAPSYELATKLADEVDSLQTHRFELLDRQVLIVPFFSGGLEKVIDSDVVDVYLLGQESTLRRRFHVHPNDFTVILLGKDGGEKFRSHTLVTIDQLNRIIDAMPMRRQEMRERPR